MNRLLNTEEILPLYYNNYHFSLQKQTDHSNIFTVKTLPINIDSFYSTEDYNTRLAVMLGNGIA